MTDYKTVGNYLYFSELFSDSLGTNYRGSEVENRRPTKLRFLTVVNPTIVANTETWKRAKILLEGIKKSNIPYLFNPEKIVSEDKQTLLIFEYFKGKNFEQILKDIDQRGVQINFDLAFSIAMAVADIIEVGSSIVVSGEKSFHGFLTPDNILIQNDGKILLKNYSIFPYLERNEKIHADMVTRYGSWLTPEFLRKEKIVPQSDIYHLGYLLYKILTGKYFSFSHSEDFDSKFVNLSFRAYIPSTEKEFLTHLITFFKKTLHPDPLKRFLSIREFKEFIANYFHIEELSSITFSLAYFMSTHYGHSFEEEESKMKEELAYRIPEKRFPEPVESDKKIKKDVASDILEGLERERKPRRWIWGVAAAVVLVVAGVLFLYLNQRKQQQLEITKLRVEQEQRVKQAEADRLKAQQELSNRIAQIQDEYKKKTDDQLKSMEEKLATTEKERKVQEAERQRLLDDLKKREQEAIDKAKKEEEEKQLLADQERKKKEDEQKKIQEEIDKRRLEEQKVKEGDIVPINDVTVKPEKMNEVSPSFPSTIREKYRGKTMAVLCSILIDEKGTVSKVKHLSAVPEELKSFITNGLLNWKYKPAQKDNVKVKVWTVISMQLSF